MDVFAHIPEFLLITMICSAVLVACRKQQAATKLGIRIRSDAPFQPDRSCRNGRSHTARP